jgi:hypothetical protein
VSSDWILSSLGTGTLSVISNNMQPCMHITEMEMCIYVHTLFRIMEENIVATVQVHV